MGGLTLGIGVGWNDVEFVALNEDCTNRGKRCEEQIEVLCALSTKGSVDFSGEYHRLPCVGIKALPKQRPIPIYLGGQVDAVLDRVARLGDGWLPMDSPDVAASRLEKLNYFCEQAGHDVREIDIPCMINPAGHDLDWIHA